MEYSSLLGGFAVVLADGRGGFLSAETASFDCSVSFTSNAFWVFSEWEQGVTVSKITF